MRSSAVRLAWRAVLCTTTLQVPATTAASPSPRHSLLAARSIAVIGCQCTTRRFVATRTRPLRQSWGETRVRPWMCIKKECRTVNRAVAAKCESCETAKPPLQRWRCVDCKTVNFAGVKQCKQCKAASQKSSGYWMCASCEENNRVDEIEGNSVCGFCAYDMAPRTPQQEEAARRVGEAAAQRQQQQEHFDSIPFSDADEQFADPMEGSQHLDASLRGAHASAVPQGSSRRLRLPKVGPFVAPDGPAPSRHSSLHRRSRSSSAMRTVQRAASVPEGPPGFDWMCRVAACAHINPGDEEKCLKCSAHITPEEWECLTCAAMNHETRSRCFHCRTPIPVCWNCDACGTATSVYDRTCRSCGAERAATEPKRVSDIVNGGGRMHAGGFTAQRDKKRGDWYCTSCNRLNFSRRDECFQCSAPRPAGSDAAEGDSLAAAGWGDGASTLDRHAAPMHNNWICTHCAASNFRTRHDCWKCGRASEFHGGWSAETNAPQFANEGFQTGAEDRSAEGQMNSAWAPKSDSWTCAKCFTSNFNSRLECHRCGAAKSTVLAPRKSKARRPVKL